MRNIKPKEIVDLVFHSICSYQFGEYARNRSKNPKDLAYYGRGEAWFMERETKTKEVLGPCRRFVQERVEEFLNTRKDD